MLDLSSLFTITAPEPSLCDGCHYAGNIPGGSATWGGRTYAQRYCGGPPRISIHSSGRQECEHFTPRPVRVTPAD